MLVYHSGRFSLIMHSEQTDSAETQNADILYYPELNVANAVFVFSGPVQLIAYSEKTDETETLISLLDEVDKQLQIMEVRHLMHDDRTLLPLGIS